MRFEGFLHVLQAQRDALFIYNSPKFTEKFSEQIEINWEKKIAD